MPQCLRDTFYKIKQEIDAHIYERTHRSTILDELEKTYTLCDMWINTDTKVITY